MGIDIFVLVVLAIAVFKGLKKGLVVALFSLLAIIIGAAAALKLSGLAGAYLADSFPNLGRWIPFLSFLLVFILVIIAVRIVAKVIEESLDLVLMGWLNKLGGMFFYVLLYMLILSVVFFYLDKLHFISDQAKNSSVTFEFLKALAPTVMNGIGKVIPIFRDLFGDLERALEGVAEKVATH